MSADRNLPTRPNYPEEKWVDYDDGSACWGVFGLTSGFCYSLHASEEDANAVLNSDTR